jgi:hypothetical protein
MKSRIATIATVLGLIAGTGGALAIANGGPHGGSNGGAASGEYKPGKGCGDKNHKHTGPPGQNDNDADNSSGVNGPAADNDKDDCGFAGGDHHSIEHHGSTHAHGSSKHEHGSKTKHGSDGRH